VAGGGFNPTRVVSFDSVSKKWSELPALEESRYGSKAAVWQGKVVLLGGASNNAAKDSVWVFEPSQKVWCAGGAMAEPVRLFALAQDETRAFVVGGYGAQDLAIDHVWMGTLSP
jgi:hypothetical protein